MEKWTRSRLGMTSRGIGGQLFFSIGLNQWNPDTQRGIFHRKRGMIQHLFLISHPSSFFLPQTTGQSAKSFSLNAILPNKFFHPFLFALQAENKQKNIIYTLFRLTHVRVKHIAFRWGPRKTNQFLTQAIRPELLSGYSIKILKNKTPRVVLFHGWHERGMRVLKI